MDLHGIETYNTQSINRVTTPGGDLLDDLLTPCAGTLRIIILRSTEGGGRQRPSIRPMHIPQYSPRSIASRDVLRNLGRIEERGQTLKCFLVLLSDYCRQITCFHAYNYNLILIKI